METKLAVLLGVATVLLGITTEISAHYYMPQYSQSYPGYAQNRYYNPYQQQRPQQQQQQQQGQVSVANAEWICKSTKSDDMMIIASEDVPQTGGSQWQQYPQQQPNYPQQRPQYPQTQPNYPHSQPTFPQTQPNYPQTQPNYPQTQPSYPNYPVTTKPTQGPPNTNGEGVIDIRMGE